MRRPAKRRACTMSSRPLPRMLSKTSCRCWRCARPEADNSGARDSVLAAGGRAEVQRRRVGPFGDQLLLGLLGALGIDLRHLCLEGLQLLAGELVAGDG